MRGLKRYLQFYFIGLILLFLISLFFGGQIFFIIRNIGFWILPAIFSLFGIVIGVVVYELKLKPISKKNRIFLIGYSISLVALLILTVIFQYKAWDHKQNFANIEDNHDVMKYWVNDYDEHIKVAFTKLESTFENPNDFKLNSYFVRSQDTLINNNSKETVYNIYFTYSLTNDTSLQYFSKVAVFQNSPTLLIYNQNTKTNSEYLNLKSQNDKEGVEALQSLKNTLNQLPDSVKKALRDTIRKTINY